MNKYEYVLFDLDGTLIDSGPGIISSIMYALEKIGSPCDNPEIVRACIGPPLSESLREIFGIEESKIETAIGYYRERYSAGELYNASVYAGIDAVLDSIKKSGRKIVMATSKPEHFARLIAKELDFEKYFDYIGGATLESNRTTKSEVIEYVLDVMGNPPIDKVIMVGDRKYDIIGARKYGIQTIGVLYGGYGTIEEMVEEGAAYIAETPADILKYI